MRLHIVNFSDRHWKHNRYVLHFGAYGDTLLMIWANHLEDAFDEAVDWLVDNSPGLLCDEQVNDEYSRIEKNHTDSGFCLELEDEEAFYEQSTVDVSTSGNCGNHVLSHEWGILAENPSCVEIKQLRRLVS